MNFYAWKMWALRSQCFSPAMNGLNPENVKELKSWVPFWIYQLKVAFIQKVLMHLSFPQTDEPYYFPELEFWIWEFEIFQKRAWCSSQGSNSKMEHYLNPSEPLLALIWHDLSPLKSHNFKIQAQENNEVCLFEEMTNSSMPSE